MKNIDRVVTAVLGGGQGTRLWPLTKHRAKPAVPLGGKFRLIDIPLSNSLHAGIDKIYLLTQFNSASLHRHVAWTYRFDVFRNGFVNILAAQQTIESREWYQGTADAVRQNLQRILFTDPSEVLILAGDQLYLMDLAEFVFLHRDSGADITIAVTPVTPDKAASFGIMQVDSDWRITSFVEKPTDPKVVTELLLTETQLRRLGFPENRETLLASMGMYVFKPDVLTKVLTETTFTDFGKEVIPFAIERYKVYVYIYTGYWEDIGTIKSFHKANLELTVPLPPLNLYSSTKPIYTHPRFLPGAKINRCEVIQSILCEGSILTCSSVKNSIIGIRTMIREGTEIENSVVMGATFYEHGVTDDIPLGIGKNCVIKNSIIDLDVRIGNDVTITNAKGIEFYESETYSIRSGIVVIPKGVTIPDGTVI